MDRLKPTHVDLDHLTTLPEHRHLRKPLKQSNTSPPPNQLLSPNLPQSCFTIIHQIWSSSQIATLLHLRSGGSGVATPTYRLRTR